MGSRLKEDEKNERIIRNLLKIPENRRCINCNSLGPQYVCTNFSTFVCTTCSGIHREFTHRVKSVSMAKFTPQEVSALQGGGNASAREIYLKEWDPQRNSLPDASNVERLRDFIKHVYVDRRYTGERKPEKSLRENMGESVDFNGNRRTDSSHGGSRSPAYEDPERRYGERPSPAGRSPGYDQEVRRYSDNKKSPARAEVVNDWRREDRFGNTRRSEDSSDGGSRLGGRSPDSQRDSEISSPPLVRPVRDILGDNVSPLRVIEPPKATVAKATDGSARTQRTASSSSLASADGNPSEVKVEASLIDFDSVPEPPATVTVPKAQVATDAHVQPPALGDDNWANFDSVPQVKVNTASSNSVESVLLGLSVPAATTGLSSAVGKLPLQSSGSPDSSSGSSFGFFAPPGGNTPASLGPAPQLTDSGGSLFANAPTGGQWPTMNPQQPSGFPGGSGQPFRQPVTPATGGSSSNRPWNQPVAPHPHMPLGASGAQVGQAGIRPAMDTSLQPASEPSLNVQSGGRKELPQDLFAMNYSYMPPPVSGWYSGSPYGAGVSMQYQMPLAVPNTQPVSRSTNPFDFGSEPPSVQPSVFPSMAPLQGALPSNATPSGPLRTSSLGTASANAPAMFTQASPYASGIPPRPYLGQETFGSMAPRPQGPFGFGLDDPAFTSLNPNHQQGGPHPSHSSSSNFTSTGGSGNPFG